MVLEVAFVIGHWLRLSRGKKLFGDSDSGPVSFHSQRFFIVALSRSTTTMSRPSSSGTFQPLRHRSGTMRDRLHGYTKRTLGAGGSMNEAVSLKPKSIQPVYRHV